jgi:hypothetical protein
MSDTDTRTRRNELYDTDFYAWTREQARLLRERRFDDLDLDNLVDEVESVGSSEKREIRNRLKVLLAHLLKWKYQPGFRRNSWRWTIHEQRETIADIAGSSPSLRDHVSKSMRGAYSGAMVAASEESGLAIGIFPDECPFSADQLLDVEFFPEDRANE